MRTIRLLVALTVSALTATPAPRAQQSSAPEQGMQKAWDFKEEQDKVTAKKVLTATATVASPETPSHVYRLTFKCDGDSREVTLGAFETIEASQGTMLPRRLDWQTHPLGRDANLPSVTVTDVSIRYSVDNREPDTFYEHPANKDSSNAAKVSAAVFVTYFGPLDVVPSELTLPTTRLLVSVFPDETAEFPFSTLTSDARKAMGSMCGFVDPTSAPEGTGGPKPALSPSEPQPILAHSADGEGVYKSGNGVTSPELLHEVKPNYTRDAVRARIEGTVDLQAIVMTDGAIEPSSLKITRSLDPKFGLDEEAKKAVRQWRFRPGICNRPDGCGGVPQGKPVPVLIVVELTFTLRK